MLPGCQVINFFGSTYRTCSIQVLLSIIQMLPVREDIPSSGQGGTTFGHNFAGINLVEISWNGDVNKRGYLL